MSKRISAKLVGALLFSSLNCSTVWGQMALLTQARTLSQAGHADKALRTLSPAHESSRPDSERALALVLAGDIHLSIGQPEEARQHLEKSLVLKTNVSAYAFYLLGESYIKLKRYKDARAALERVGYFKPPSELKFQVRYSLTEIAMAEKNLNEANRHLTYLARKWKRSPNFPDVLWRQMEVSVLTKNIGQACRVARRLYAEHPTHSLTYDWTLSLQNATVAGQRLGCVANSSDQSTRIRRLQLAGESARARREMDSLRVSGRPEDIERADMMLVNFLISEGYPEDALRILSAYFQAHQKSVPFILLLAKAASRAGEFQTAVGMFMKAHELIPFQKFGREALFQAAFMSYQFQDYDGAMRRFERFIELYPSSGLARDARWNLAWVRYLRGDYEGAYEHLALQNAAKATMQGRGKKRRLVAPARDDRTVYWMAMTLARMGKLQEAKTLFESLEKPDASSFYAMAAKVRRAQLPSPSSQEEVPLRGPALATTGAAADAQAEIAVNSEAPNENESEDNLSLNKEVVPVSSETGEEDTGVDLSDDGPVDSDDDEKIEVTDFKDPRLRRRFEVAQDLIAIGHTDWARHELYEVERRTRNPAFLKSLVKTYETIQSFHRAVSISDSFFGQERIQGGYINAKAVWETAYPKAYKSYVERFSSQFSLPTELIWSIMRAESHYKPDVLSPVGAKGLMQVMPETGRQVSRLLDEEEQFKPMSLLNPETNIRLGSRYLLRLSTKFKSSVPLVAAAYNAGPHRVDSWLAQFGHLEMDEFIEHIPFLETRNYVKKVSRNFGVYRNLYSSDRRELTWLASSLPVQITGRPTPREIWEN